jgi:hypothetical protein
MTRYHWHEALMPYDYCNIILVAIQVIYWFRYTPLMFELRSYV